MLRLITVISKNCMWTRVQVPVSQILIPLFSAFRLSFPPPSSPLLIKGLHVHCIEIIVSIVAQYIIAFSQFTKANTMMKYGRKIQYFFVFPTWFLNDPFGLFIYVFEANKK